MKTRKIFFLLDHVDFHKHIDGQCCKQDWSTGKHTHVKDGDNHIEIVLVKVQR